MDEGYLEDEHAPQDKVFFLACVSKSGAHLGQSMPVWLHWPGMVSLMLLCGGDR